MISSEDKILVQNHPLKMKMFAKDVVKKIYCRLYPIRICVLIDIANGNTYKTKRDILSGFELYDV